MYFSSAEPRITHASLRTQSQITRITQASLRIHRKFERITQASLRIHCEFARITQASCTKMLKYALKIDVFRVHMDRRGALGGEAVILEVSGGQKA